MKKNPKVKSIIGIAYLSFALLLFQSITAFSQGKYNGLYPIVKDGKYSFIDKDGKVVFDVDNRCGTFSNGMAFFIDNTLNKIGFIDTTGKIVVQPAYVTAVPFYEELSAVNVNGKWGFIDKKGTVVIDPHYAFAFRFCEGFAGLKNQQAYIANGALLIKKAIG